ncbi:MAG TPA: RNA methyltransferase [Anaerolineales bacterium]|nr:RNA methyltransferase [Anaerolineales bacterium]
MSDLIFEIRVCEACGLRYPLQQGHAFGIRCPHCLGETKIALEKTIHEEQKVREKPEKSDYLRAVLLDNVRSAWNVGSVLRSADGFGFSHVYLCGITPTPENESVTKTSLGAEEYLTWSQHKDAVKLVKGLKKEGWKIFALEEDKRAVHVNALPASDKKMCLILGSEVTGVDPSLLDLCDGIFYIPMFGQKRSLNVAIAFSVAAYAARAAE